MTNETMFAAASPNYNGGLKSDLLYWLGVTTAFGGYMFRNITRQVMAVVFDIIAAPLQAGMLAVFATRYSAEQLAYLTPGLVFYSVLATSLVSTPGQVVTLKDAKLLRRFRTSPAPTSAILAGIAAAVALVALCGSVLTLIVSRVVSDVPLPPNLAAFFGVWLIGSLTMTAAGLLIANFISRPGNAVALALPILFLSIGLSGLYATGPQTGLLAQLGFLHPARPVCDWLRATALGTSIPIWEPLLSLSWLGVLGWLSVRSFKWE